VFPFEGKVYNSLAVISVKEQDYLSSIYYFMRALSCHIPFETAKEILIDHFEEIRVKYMEEKNTSRLRPVPKSTREDKKFYDFILVFFRV
jgi:hypothetical protein